MLNRLRTFVYQARAVRRARPQSFDAWNTVRHYPKWLKKLSGRSPIEDHSAWITFGALEFLDKTLTKNMRVAEYGAGGSTLFFAERVNEVVTIESDAEWARNTKAEVDRLGFKNWRLHLHPAEGATSNDPTDPDCYASSLGIQYKAYAKAIDEYPDHYFDAVLIDGRARPSSFKHAFPKVKRTGLVILDNAEREHYRYIRDSMNGSGWERHDFYGPGPFIPQFWQTVIWRGRDNGNAARKR